MNNPATKPDPITTGQYRVGIGFNPSGDDLVASIKGAAALLIDMIDGIDLPAAEAGGEQHPTLTHSHEVARLKALAMTAIEDAAMWAVKAATKPSPMPQPEPERNAAKVDELVEKIAQVAHEANRAWCLRNGDTSQPPWSAAPEWLKSSVIDGVLFHMENPDASDSASHDNWCRYKYREGWVYGEVKDPDATPPTHPNMVPFDQLDAVQKTKDSMFRSIVHAALKNADLT